MKAALTILAFALLLCVVMVAQQSQQIRLTLHVPQIGSLALVNAAAAPSRQVTVHVRRSQSGDASIVQLLARSNSAYRLRVEPPALRLGEVTVTPNAGGARLMPDAMNVRTFSGVPSFLEGPRISNGGNNNTPDNALVVSVPIELPEGVSEADLNFRIELLPN